MSRGLPYDSDAGRDFAGAITAVMTGEAYAQSARVARDHGGPFAGYDINREPFLRVMRKHRDAIKDINAEARARRSLRRRQAGVGRRGRARRGLRLPQRAGHRARADRHHRLHDGLRHHRRRARHRAREVQEARRRRHDEDRQPDGADGAAASWATPPRRSTTSSSTSTSRKPSKARRTCWSATCRCSTAPSRRTNGERSIHYMGHIKMMGATQPFISGAISKTVNVPKDATRRGHRAGLSRDVAPRRQGDLDLPRRLASARSRSTPRRRRSTPRASIASESTDGCGQGRGRRGAGRARADAPQAAGRAARHHPQVRHLGPRGLHHRRPVRGRACRARSSW